MDSMLHNTPFQITRNCRSVAKSWDSWLTILREVSACFGRCADDDELALQSDWYYKVNKIRKALKKEMQ